jgi:hypothetical protein
MKRAVIDLTTTKDIIAPDRFTGAMFPQDVITASPLKQLLGVSDQGGINYSSLLCDFVSRQAVQWNQLMAFNRDLSNHSQERMLANARCEAIIDGWCMLYKLLYEQDAPAAAFILEKITERNATLNKEAIIKNNL